MRNVHIQKHAETIIPFPAEIQLKIQIFSEILPVVEENLETLALIFSRCDTWFPHSFVWGGGGCFENT